MSNQTTFMMQTQSADGRLDHLKKGIADLTEEKNQLEKHLKELVVKEKEVNGQVQEARKQFNEVLKKCLTSNESLTLATNKVEQEEIQCKNIEDTLKQLRIKIEDLQQSLNTEKTQQITNLEEFEDKMGTLVLLFMDAISLYTDAGLQEAIQNAQAEAQQVDSMVKKTQEDIEKVSKNTEAIYEEECHWEAEVPAEQRQTILLLLQDERDTMQRILEQIQGEKHLLEEELAKHN